MTEGTSRRVEDHGVDGGNRQVAEGAPLAVEAERHHVGTDRAELAGDELPTGDERHPGPIGGEADQHLDEQQVERRGTVAGGGGVALTLSGADHDDGVGADAHVGSIAGAEHDEVQPDGCDGATIDPPSRGPQGDRRPPLGEVEEGADEGGDVLGLLLEAALAGPGHGGVADADGVDELDERIGRHAARYPPQWGCFVASHVIVVQDDGVERQTSVALDDDGRPVVRHVAGPGPAADALRHEATALAQGRGLGVVEVVALREGPGEGATLDTRFVPGGSLHDLAPGGDERTIVAMLAAVAATLARLHDVGVVHGRCSADHVLGTPGDVRLCGLRDARTGPGPVGSAAEVDTRAFAELVEATCVGDHELARRACHAVRGLDASPPTTSLLAVAAHLRRLAGDFSAPGGRVLTPRRREPTRRSPLAAARTGAAAVATGAGARVLVAVAVALIAAVVTALVLLPPERRPASAPRAADPPAPAGAGGQRTPATQPPDTPDDDPPPPSAAPATPPSPPSPPAGTEGAVEHDGVRYQVGAPGDLVVIGDWECDGVVTPGLVRPADGSVWAFRSWALGNEVVVAERVGRASEPRQAVVARADDGCDVIAVTTSDGDEVIITAS